jgi:hypothetical protein
MCACGSPAWQAFGVQSSGDHVGLRGVNLGITALEGLRSGSKDWRSHGLLSNSSMSLCGVA